MAKGRVKLQCISCKKIFAKEKICFDGKERPQEWEKWMTENYKGLCPRCKREKFRNEINSGLPILTGSEKEISYAISIRIKATAEIKSAGNISYEAAKEIISKLPKDASWWISHKQDVNVIGYYDHGKAQRIKEFIERWLKEKEG